MRCGNDTGLTPAGIDKPPHAAGAGERWFGLLVAVTAFLVYANSLGNGFVADDHSVILNNPVLQGTPLSLFTSIDTTSAAELLPFYRPVTYLSFWLESRIHGFNPLSVRLFNILLHSVNALLVYRLARPLCSGGYAALGAALLFAVHPLHTEGVDYNAGGRNTMLACLFVLAAYLSHRKAVSSSSYPGGLSGALLFLTGLFSKELTLALLPFLVALEVSHCRRNRGGTWGPSLARLLPYLAATVCYLVMRWVTFSRYGIQTGLLPGMGSSLPDPGAVPALATRLMNNIYIIPQYLMTVLWPMALSPRYTIPPLFLPHAAWLTAAWLGIAGCAGWLLTKGRSPVSLFGMAWLTAFWLPVSGIIYFSDNQLADRFLYVPAIGLWLIVADQTARLVAAATPVYRTVIAATGVAVCLALALLTVNRNRDWKSDLTLNQRLIADYPDNPYGHANLGSAYIDRKGDGDLQRAEQEFTRALALDPGMRSLHTPLGYIALTSGDYARALSHYTEALAASPADRDARINRAIALEKLGRIQEAVDEYRTFLSLPGYDNLPGAREYAADRLHALAP